MNGWHSMQFIAIIYGMDNKIGDDEPNSRISIQKFYFTICLRCVDNIISLYLIVNSTQFLWLFWFYSTSLKYILLEAIRFQNAFLYKIKGGFKLLHYICKCVCSMLFAVYFIGPVHFSILFWRWWWQCHWCYITVIDISWKYLHKTSSIFYITQGCVFFFLSSYSIDIVGCRATHTTYIYIVFIFTFSLSLSLFHRGKNVWNILFNE